MWGDESGNGLGLDVTMKEAYASRAVQFYPNGGQLDFAWLPARTTHPCVAYVW